MIIERYSFASYYLSKGPRCNRSSEKIGAFRNDLTQGMTGEKSIRRPRGEPELLTN